MPKIKLGQMDDGTEYSCKQFVERLRKANHDIKGHASIVHGYISLMRLDVDEGNLTTETMTQHLDEMEAMLEKAYGVSEEISTIVSNIVCDDE